jgi:hypothetical protein
MEILSVSFSDYYKIQFRTDLNSVIEGAKTMGSIGQHVNETPLKLQSMTVSTKNPTISSWSKVQSDLFASALYYTVLIDQACYSDFGYFYEDFQQLTVYPKYVGQCLSICHIHLNPSFILKHVGGNKGVDHSSINPMQLSKRQRLVLDAMPFMKSEVLQFIEKFMPELNGEEFWKVCEQEINELTK